jgi:hypothetical protein
MISSEDALRLAPTSHLGNPTVSDDPNGTVSCTETYASALTAESNLGHSNTAEGSLHCVYEVTSKI